MTEPSVETVTNREAVAHREIGVTEIARSIAGLVVGLFLATVTLVPVAEVGRILAEPGGASSFVELARQRIEPAWRALGNRGLLAANRAVLEQIHLLEDALDEGSVVAEAVLPTVQSIQTAWLGVGNEQALLGRDGWLFYRPSVELLTGRGFLEAEILDRRSLGGDSWEAPPHPDPRKAILQTRDELAARGIELIVLPAPVKPSIHPGRFSRRANRVELPLANPSFESFLRELEEAGVTVLDPAPSLAARAGGGEEQYLARDTHWTPNAMEHVAAQLAVLLEGEYALGSPEPQRYARRATEVSGRGDLTEMLQLPEDQELFPLQTVEIRPVVESSGALWSPDPQAEVLVLGDSFTNVFSTPDLGWGSGAGLAEQLAFHLQRPVDRIAINAGGAHSARARLAELQRRGSDRLEGKKVVVWQFATRELAFGDWRPIPLDGIAPGAAGPALPASHLEDGFVVWESNRTGDWRIFAQDLDGTNLRQITPDEPGMQHCCPHISPDGGSIAYLSRPVGKTEYPAKEVPGPLRLISTRDWSERTLLPAARNYGWGNRAVVWRNDRELIAVGPDGRTLLVDRQTGETRQLTTEPREELGWLLDPTLSWATNAAPVFAPYDAEAKRVVPRAPLGGCEPYFTQDGRWGYWIAGAGGPLNRMDLETRDVTTLLSRNDPRLPAEQRYVYFSMISRDGQLLAYGASDGDHHHFEADYDVYVTAIDPETLELAGQPVRITRHPATDRYPDAYLAPLGLGRHRGEAPFTVEFAAPGEATWRWSLDGERVAEGPRWRRTFDEPGVYRVEARSPDGDGTERGQIVVEAAAPPEVRGVELREGGRRVLVRFDEPIDADEARVTLDPEGTLRSWRASEDRRGLVVELAEELRAGGRLRLEGILDEAQRPNRMESRWLEIAPPTWPSTREGLLFLWRSDDHPNLVLDPRTGEEKAFPLEGSGRVYLDRNYAMVLDGGAFVAPEDASQLIVSRIADSNEVSVELTITPGDSRTAEPRNVLTLSKGAKRPHLVLRQEGADLTLRLLTNEQRAAPPVRLTRLTPGEPRHVLLTYLPASLKVWVDGEPVPVADGPRGSFGPWRDARLLFGDEWGGGARWEGTLEGIALWDRALSEAEAREGFLRYRRVLSGRGEVDRREVRARLRGKSSIPTLAQISPYRKALVVFEYEVVEGPDRGETVRVVHWALLDGERQPMAGLRPGSEMTLRLERFAENPQLEPHFLSDTLADPAPGPLWYAVEARPASGDRR